MIEIENTKPGQSRSVMIGLDPVVVELLEGVAFRLKAAGSASDVGEADPWQIREGYPGANLSMVREGIQNLQKIMVVATEIAAAAEEYMRIVKERLMGIGLFSLPVELLQDILHRSLIGDSKAEPNAGVDIRRVLALQSVSRYFRNVVQSTPGFWTSASSENVPLLELQLERSKGLGLNLELVASDLLDSKLHDIITTHSSRWQTLVLRMQDSDLGGAIQEKVSSLTLEKLTSFDLHVRSSPSVHRTGNSLKFDFIRTPELTRLCLFDCQPHTVAANLTEFSFSFERYAAWSGCDLVLFIASQKALKNLVFRVNSPPNDSEGQIERLVEYLAPACDRNMFVILKLSAWSYTAAMVPLWSAISSFGVATLELDFTVMGSNLQTQSLRKALYYSHGTPGLETLIISFPSFLSTFRIMFEDYFDEKLEFPSSLRIILIRNSRYGAMDIIFGRLARLMARQEAIGSPHPVEVIFSGEVLPDDEVTPEVLARKVDYSHARGADFPPSSVLFSNVWKLV